MSPAINLTSGVQYTIDYTIFTDYGGGKEDIEILLCTATDESSLRGGTVIGNIQFSNTNPELKSNVFKATSDGAYYIAFHCISAAYQGNITIKGFSINGQASSGKENANLSFNSSELSIYLAKGAVDMPALSNINNVEGIVYTVSPEGIVEIADGKLNPLAAGEATLTASVPEDNAEWEGSATCKITVKGSITLEPNDISFKMDKNYMAYTYSPDKTLQYLPSDLLANFQTFEADKVTWSIKGRNEASEGAATIDPETGVVTVLKAGTATSVTDENAIVMDVYATTVEGVYTAGTTTSYPATLLLMKGNATVTFPVSEYEYTEGLPAEWPQPATEPEGVKLAYSSSDGDIAQPVRYTTGGYEVYTYGYGTATITASVDDPLYTGEPASYELTVKGAAAPTFEVVESPLNAITVTPDESMPNTWMLNGFSALAEYEINLTVNEPYDSFAWVIMDYGIGFSDKARRAEDTEDPTDSYLTKDQIAEYFDGMVYGFGNPIRIPVIGAPTDEPAALADEDEPAENQTVTVVIMPGIGERYNDAGRAGYGFYSNVKYDSSTAVKTIEAADGEAVYFNLQGVRVANPEKGAFVKVQNGKAAKVML